MLLLSETDLTRINTNKIQAQPKSQDKFENKIIFCQIDLNYLEVYLAHAVVYSSEAAFKILIHRKLLHKLCYFRADRISTFQKII